MILCLLVAQKWTVLNKVVFRFLIWLARRVAGALGRKCCNITRDRSILTEDVHMQSTIALLEMECKRDYLERIKVRIAISQLLDNKWSLAGFDGNHRIGTSPNNTTLTKSQCRNRFFLFRQDRKTKNCILQSQSWGVEWKA